MLAHWLLFSGDCISNPSDGEKFWDLISWLLFTFKLINDNAKCSIHESIDHVWLSIRLNILIAGQKQSRQKIVIFLLASHHTLGQWEDDPAEGWLKPFYCHYTLPAAAFSLYNISRFMLVWLRIVIHGLLL